VRVKTSIDIYMFTGNGCGVTTKGGGTVRRISIDNEKGFTLVELLVAMIIIMVALVPLLYMFTNGMTTTFDTQRRQVATTIAEKTIEEVRTLSFASVASVAEATVTEDNRFTREVVVTDRSATLKEINVIVRWTERGSGQSVDLTTLLAER